MRESPLKNISRTLGEDRVREILKVLASYSFAHSLLQFLYKDREGTKVDELSDELGEDYHSVYRCASRLIKNGVIRKDDASNGGLTLTQLGLDFLPAYEKLNPTSDLIEAGRRKNVNKALAELKKGGKRWKELKKELDWSSSSQKVIIDLLLTKDLIEKEGGKYKVTKKGRNLLKKLECLTSKNLNPRYEIQLKYKIHNNSFADICEIIEERLKNNITSTKKIRQEDHYLESKSSSAQKSYLRYRLERPEKGSLTEALSCKISWSKNERFIEKNDLRVLKRQKETIGVDYPAILFFLEYLGGKEIKEITKRRCIFSIRGEFEINVDEIIHPEKSTFIEIKKSFWISDEKNEIMNRIQNLFEKLELKSSEPLRKTYIEIFTSSRKRHGTKRGI